MFRGGNRSDEDEPATPSPASSRQNMFRLVEGSSPFSMTFIQKESKEGAPNEYKRVHGGFHQGPAMCWLGVVHEIKLFLDVFRETKRRETRRGR